LSETILIPLGVLSDQPMTIAGTHFDAPPFLMALIDF